MLMCCTIVVARNRLFGCHAYTMFGLAKNMHSRNVLPNGVAPCMTSPLLSARREAVGLTSRFNVRNRAGNSSSGGVAFGEPSSPPPEWNLRVPLDEYVALGPRYRQQQQQLPEGWLAEAADLAASLGIDPPTSTEAQHRRVFHLYLPVYFWLKELLLVSRRQRGSVSSPSPSSPRDLAAAAPPTELEQPCAEGVTSERVNRSGGETSRPPLVVGISAPQGCGKTTIVAEMQRMLEKAGHSCVVVSIDDFYLTGAEQVSLR